MVDALVHVGLNVPMYLFIVAIAVVDVFVWVTVFVCEIFEDCEVEIG